MIESSLKEGLSIKEITKRLGITRMNYYNLINKEKCKKNTKAK